MSNNRKNQLQESQANDDIFIGSDRQDSDLPEMLAILRKLAADGSPTLGMQKMILFDFAQMNPSKDEVVRLCAMIAHICGGKLADETLTEVSRWFPEAYPEVLTGVAL